MRNIKRTVAAVVLAVGTATVLAITGAAASQTASPATHLNPAVGFKALGKAAAQQAAYGVPVADFKALGKA